jgi:site-specific recombinase XerD
MHKYTSKLILWKHDPNKHGHLPIYLRITIDRKTRYISTGRYVPKIMWDEKNQRIKEGFPDSSLYNAEITTKKTEIVRKMVDSQVKGSEISASSIKHSFAYNLHNIFEFADNYAQTVKNKRQAATIENYRKHLLRLELYHGSRNLNFEDITVDYLTRYENHLRQTVKNNYTQKLLIAIRTMFNAAKKKELITCYPFDQFEMPAYQSPIKDYLTLDELSKWEEFADQTTNQVHKQSAVYFLLGCYSGLRISDWRSFDIKKMVENDRIKLRAKKNREWVTMPISEPLKRNLKRIQALPLDIEEPTINEKLKIIARELKISKRITTHSGRHTFAITICADQGISSETCAELMGITVATCVGNYYRVTNRKIDNETMAAWANLT